MSSFELRLTLLVIAVLAIVIMLVWYRGYTKEKYRDDDDDFDLLSDDEEIGFQINSAEELEVSSDLREEFQGVSQQIKQDVTQERMLKAQQVRERKHVDPKAKELLVIMHVKASTDQPFTGPVILQMMKELGLEHGEMDVFHYSVERLNHKKSLFSILNMVKPGYFKLDEMDEFTTPGLTLLLQLPGPEDGLKAFNIMLNAAQRLATFMNGTLLDENRMVLTNQGISHLKEQVQLFSLCHVSRASGT